jgi:hypothetical protein
MAIKSWATAQQKEVLRIYNEKIIQENLKNNQDKK